MKVSSRVALAAALVATLAASSFAQTHSGEFGLRFPRPSSRAQLIAADREVRRVKLSLTARFAAAFTSYQTSARAVVEYQHTIIPDTARALDMFADRFRRCESSYPDAQDAQRAPLDAQQAYLAHYRAMWRAVTDMRSMLLIAASEPAGTFASEE
jgi:hypothetical protein